MFCCTPQLDEPCNHQVAPNGDVVLLLENTNAPFAIFDHANAPTSTNTGNGPSFSIGSVTYLVSSHHLKLASPVFNAALTGPWIESTRPKGGCHRINIKDWDAEALLIVLNIIHGRNSRVPKTISLEMLCKVSVLVDYYHVHEAVRFPSLLWVCGLRPSVPETYSRDLILWLCVSWVFQDDEIFKSVTGVAIRDSTESVPTLQLPIAEAVVGMSQKHGFAALLHKYINVIIR